MADETTPGADDEELSEQDLELVTEELAEETADGVVGGLGEAGIAEAASPGLDGII